MTNTTTDFTAVGHFSISPGQPPALLKIMRCRYPKSTWVFVYRLPHVNFDQFVLTLAMGPRLALSPMAQTYAFA